MIQRLLKLLQFAIFSTAFFDAHGQLVPCQSSKIEPSDDCGGIPCLHCQGVAGFVGQTDPWTADQPGGYCETAENNQWVAFVASCESATFTVTPIPGTCENKNGLELALYDRCDAGAPLACNPGCLGCGDDPQSITYDKLTINATYFLMIDGKLGDKCDFVLSVTPPTCSKAPTIGLPSPIQGPSKICPGGTATFCIPPIIGPAVLRWEENNQVLLNGQPDQVEIFGQNGLCVTAYFPPTIAPGTVVTIGVRGQNDCSIGPTRTKNILVTNIPTTIAPVTTLCWEDASGYVLPDGTTIAQIPGQTNYNGFFVTPEGCDSTVVYPIRIRPQNIVNITKKACLGECLEVGGEIFCDPGFYQIQLESSLGCDSLINFSYQAVDVNAVISLDTATIYCNVDSITLGSITSPGVKTWTRNGSFFGQGNTVIATQGGQYILTVSQIISATETCVERDTIDIGEDLAKPILTVNSAVLTCSNPTAQLLATSPTPNLAFFWSGGASPPNVSNPTVSAAGNYTVTATDPINGCTSTKTAVVTGNSTVPIATATGQNLTCTNPTANLLATSNIAGSAFSWSSGASPQNSAAATTTSAGLFTVTVTNPSNGCTATATASVGLNNAAPGVSVSASSNIGCATPTVVLTANSMTSGATFSWPNGSGGSTFSTSSAGVFSVTATGPNGCVSTAAVTVSGSTTVPGATASGGVLTCFSPQTQLLGSSNATNATFSWAGPSGQNSTLQNPFVSNSGAWTLTTTDPANGCTSSATASVGQDIAPPTAQATGGVINCTNTQVALGQAFSPSNSTILWTGPGGFSTNLPSPTTTSPGNYLLTVTAPNGCTATATATVTGDPGLPTANVSVSNIIDCVNSEAMVTGGTTTSGATFLWTLPSGATSTATSFQTNEAGNYLLTVTGPNGCTAQSTAFVQKNDSPPGASAAGASLTCTTPQAAISATSPSQNVVFAWSGPSGFLSNLQNPTISDPGLYLLTVTSTATGCVSTASATVLGDQNAPVAAASGGTIDCKKGSIELAGSANAGGVSFSWTGPNGFSSSDQNPTVAVAGQYVLTVLATNGCVDQATATVVGDVAPPDATAFSANDLDCKKPISALAGGSATAGATFLWTGPNGFSSDQKDATASEAGLFLLTVTGPNGCTATASATVAADFQQPDLMANGGVLTCKMPVLTLFSNSTTVGAIFLWQGPSGFSSVLKSPDATEKGQYSITATAPNGCTSSLLVDVLEDKKPPENVSVTGGEITCAAPAVQASATSSTPNVGFEWFAANGASVSVLQNPILVSAGVFTVVVTDAANGCTASATATVTTNGAFPTVQPTVSNVLDCKNPTAQLAATTSAANGSFQWFLIVNGQPTLVSTAQNFIVSTAGTYQIAVTETATGCKTTEPIAVLADFSTPQNVTATGANLTCTNPTAAILGNSTTAGVTFFWTGPNGFSSTEKSPTVGEAGLFLLTVTGPNGCTATATATANVILNSSTPSATVNSGILTCASPNLTLKASSNQAVNFVWSTGATTSEITVATGGTFSVTLTNAATGCSNTATTTVLTDINAPIATLAVDGKLACEVNVVAVSATILPAGGAFSFAWTGPGIVGASNVQNIEAEAAGTYSLVVTDPANGCSSTATILVEAGGSIPQIGFSVKNARCFGEKNGSASVQGVLGGTGPYLFSIDGGPFSAQQNFNQLAPGSHRIETEDATGCKSEVVFEVLQPAQIVVQLGNDTTVSFGSTISIDLENLISPASGSYVLNWAGGFLGCDTCGSEAIFKPLGPTVIRLEVVDSSGCRGLDEQKITIDSMRNIYAPTIFSPDKGAPNDRFYLFANSTVEEIEQILIFNRWGGNVFEALNFQPNDPAFGWDGRLYGQKLPPSVYTYFAKIRFIGGETILFKGEVTLAN